MFTPTYKKDIGLYIHIPFCTKKCHYCAFAVVTDNSRMDEYVEKLIFELEEKLKWVKENNRTIYTIYFGGGTPSTLTITLLAKILEKIDLKNVEELSIECNPEDVTLEYISSLKNLGFHRISLGVQTLQTSLLKSINRSHDSLQATNAMYILQEAGISWNADIILGLPHSDSKNTIFDIEKILEFGPGHISLYFYTKEKSSVFGHQKNLGIPKEKDLMQTYDKICILLKQKGYIQYEFSNWAKSDYESKHNLMNWLGMEYIGVGMSASSFFDNQSAENPANLNIYLKNSLHQNVTPYTQKDMAIRYIMLGLRLETGVTIDCISEFLTSTQIDSLVASIADSHLSKVVVISGTHMYLTPEGRLFHSSIVDFLYDEVMKMN